MVGTPVDRHLNPTVGDVYRSIDALLDHMQDGALLVLRSTVYPGVTKLVHERLRRLNRKILLSFCPERIAEGNAVEELIKLPQIVSGFEPEATAAASRLFGLIAPSLIELAPAEAELAKLFTNAWRYANFAISNQFYILAQSRGLDFYRIHDAVTRDYPRMRSFAKAGFAARAVPAERHAAIGRVLPEQFLSWPCGHADQRRPADVSGGTASAL